MKVIVLNEVTPHGSINLLRLQEAGRCMVVGSMLLQRSGDCWSGQNVSRC